MLTTTDTPHRAEPPRATHAHGTLVPLFRFQFQRQYDGLYSNRHERFVLRQEHISTLKRLSKEHARDRFGCGDPMTMSDIVNAALDFALEHPLAFHASSSPDGLRDALAREVYRKAFLHFMRHELL